MAVVMIVEDDIAYRSLLCEVCRSDGHGVVEFDDAETALAAIEDSPGVFGPSRRPDLVLTDFNMANINGYEFISRLRLDERFAGIPIVMISGAGKKIEHILKLRDVDYFTKSTRVADISAFVRSKLGTKGPAVPEKRPPFGSTRLKEASPPSEKKDRFPALSKDLARLVRAIGPGAEAAGDARDVTDPQSPVASLVQEIFEQAGTRNASDIHIEPQRRWLRVRIRVDGALQDLTRLPRAVADHLTARIKVICGLDITERRLPQDGQCGHQGAAGTAVKLRVSTMPAAFGEKIVIRILRPGSLDMDVDSLGLTDRDELLVARVLKASNGLILTAGPTGSGKTTTLYTMLRALNTPDRNIVTVEDPIEYQLDGITQVQVNPAVGYSFERVLRSFLRQDPNVMLVGEIRDVETAEIALKAAVTGHLVLSTLHTGDAPSAIHRLVSMGLPPYLVAAACRLVIAQRLLRVLCRKCRAKDALAAEESALLSPAERSSLRVVWRAKGCPACNGTGYTGRRAIFEVMPVLTHEMRVLITDNRPLDELITRARSEGMGSLRSEALAMTANAITSPDEALPHICGLDAP